MTEGPLPRFCPNCDREVELVLPDGGGPTGARCDHCSIEWSGPDVVRTLPTAPIGDAARETSFARAKERAGLQ